MTAYARIGGETRVRELVDRFYDLMDSLPEVAAVRAMHPTDLAGSRDKLFWFLSGWFGGPPLFMERFGHPRLRMRHLPFRIGIAERDQWLLCMERALTDMNLSADLLAELLAAFRQMADHMRNTEEA